AHVPGGVERSIAARRDRAGRTGWPDSAAAAAEPARCPPGASRRGRSEGGRTMNRFIVLAGVVIALAMIVVLRSAFIVDQAEQAIIVQFGEPVGGVISEPGLHFRVPFIQNVRRFDKRLLTWDGDVTQIPTLGREFVIVDTTARWRIVDPLQFLRSVRDESGA